MKPPSRRRGSGAGVVNLSFGMSALASVGLAIVYLHGGQAQVEGALIFAAMGGLAVGFIVWAKRFMPEGPFAQERESLESTEGEREILSEDWGRGQKALGRRGFLGMLGAALGAFGLAALFPIRSLGPKPGRALFRTAWQAGARAVTEDGTPVQAGALNLGGILTVFPEGHTGAADSQAVLIHVDPTTQHLIPGRENWSPNGFVCYSKICTHAGCPVGLYEQESGRLFCPCHQSVFDALDGAAPIGGPATRPLPQLPLEIDPEGFVRARSDFTEPVGPSFWERG